MRYIDALGYRVMARAALTVANVGRDIVPAQDGLVGAYLPYIDLSLPERIIRQ